MNAERFAELIGNSEYKEQLTYLFEKFEHFVEDKVDLNDEFLEREARALDDEELRLHLMELRRKIPKTEKNDLLESRIDSLQRNITGFVSLSRDAQNNRSKLPRKYKRVLASYIAVSRLAIKYDEIFATLSDPAHLNKKIVLAVGMIKLEEDNILVNEEIQELYLNSNTQNVFCVVPLFECSTTYLIDTVKRISPEIVHLAGHGSGINGNGRFLLHFVDSNMTSTRFRDLALGISDLIFINCCHSLQFVYPKDPTLTALYIVHDGTVDSSTAKDFSRNFYSVLWNSMSVNAMPGWVACNGRVDGYECL